MDLVDLLHTAAPIALNRYASDGQTPLFVACHGGHESMVSKLLSVGAIQRTSLGSSLTCPLMVAVFNGFVGVVWVLMNEEGVRTVGGEEPLIEALGAAVQMRHARVLRLLLAVDGAERRWLWANINFDGIPLLHYGASLCYPAEVSVLLEARADEVVCDPGGRIPRDTVGLESVLRLGFARVGGRKSPFARYCSAAKRTELDRGCGPLTKKRIRVVAVMVPLLLLMPLSSRLRRH